MTLTAAETVRVLLVSREAYALRSLWRVGVTNSWQIDTAGSGWDALERVQSDTSPSLLVLDLAQANGDGLQTLQWLHRVRPGLPIVVLSDSGDVKKNDEAIRLGARDCIVRPLETEKLESVIKRELFAGSVSREAEPASDDVEQISDGLFFVAASPAMRKLRMQAELLAQVNVPVLIIGESGSGKQVVARLIHKLSVRSGCMFFKVNCSALPPELLESDLFGYEQDGFRAANRPRPGKFELCNKGTLLLDEIAEMPLELQEKLLHVLEDTQVLRPGSDKAIHVDVRILAATNVGLEQALAERKIREDLYYRLSAFTLQVPPLRQRKDEIPFLLRHFMHRLAKHYGLVPRTFSSRVLEACQSHVWSGNLRELENFAKRYLVIGDEELALGELGSTWGGGSGNGNLWDPPDPAGVNPTLSASTTANPGLKSLVHSVKNEAERNAIAAALDKTRWNRKAAARLLQVSYRTLLYKIDQYHMHPPAYPSFYLNGGNGVKTNGHGN